MLNTILRSRRARYLRQGEKLPIVADARDKNKSTIWFPKRGWGEKKNIIILVRII